MIETKAIETIEFKNLSFGYDGALLFSDASFALPKNEIVHLTSASGAGKSAILRLLAGLVLPTSGEYLLNKLSVGQMSFEEFLPYRLCFGFSFDHGGLLNNRTIRENLMLPLQYHKRFPEEEIVERCDEMLERFELSAAAERRPASVSGSQRKACALARALIVDPQVLLLDDPTTGLGKQAIQELVELLNKTNNTNMSRFVVIASDDADFLRQLRFSEIGIRDGRIERQFLGAA